MSKQHGYEATNYLISKYKSIGRLLDVNGRKIPSRFDYNKYPAEDYIPYCSVCLEMFNQFKISNANAKIEVECLHKSCGCLWFDYFESKMRTINPLVITVKNKSRTEQKVQPIETKPAVHKPKPVEKQMNRK